MFRHLHVVYKFPRIFQKVLLESDYQQQAGFSYIYLLCKVLFAFEEYRDTVFMKKEENSPAHLGFFMWSWEFLQVNITL